MCLILTLENKIQNTRSNDRRKVQDIPQAAQTRARL